MLMTAKEAKKLWCHLGSFHCRGDVCMAWRWGGADLPLLPQPLRMGGASVFYCTDEPPRPDDVPSSWAWLPFGGGDDIAGWFEPEEEYQARIAKLREDAEASRLGYCGLAGKPECE